MLLRYSSLFTTFLKATTLVRRSSNHNCFLHTQLHTRLTGFLVYLVFLVLPFYIRKLTVCWWFLKWNVRNFAISRILLGLNRCLCTVYTVLVVYCIHSDYFFFIYIDYTTSTVYTIHIVACAFAYLFIPFSSTLLFTCTQACRIYLRSCWYRFCLVLNDVTLLLFS